MTFENFIVEEQGNAAVVWFNRPNALNALNRATLDELTRILDDLEKKRKICGVILTGAGEKAFVAGADIAEMSGLSQVTSQEFSRRGQAVTKKIEMLRVPVIAAVNGFALGGGCEIAMACDFIMASARASFGQPEVGLGLIPGFGATVRLAEYVGWPVARELIFTGRKIRADEAKALGLVNRVVEPENLISEAVSLVNEMARNSAEAVRVAKLVMRKVRNKSSVAERLDVEARGFADMFGTFDGQEGTKAFVEKRKPQFKGE